MNAMSGAFSLGPDAGRLLVRTGRTGLGSRAGHDLTLEVTRWEGTAHLESVEPAAGSVEVTAWVDSLEVREGTGGLKPLTDGDRRDIKKNITDKILRADRHPTIEFRSTAVEGDSAALTVQGELTIGGETHPATLHATLVDDRLTGKATVQQSQWGIKPYTGFFGALKLKDDVEVAFDLSLPR